MLVDHFARARGFADNHIVGLTPEASAGVDGFDPLRQGSALGPILLRVLALDLQHQRLAGVEPKLAAAR